MVRVIADENKRKKKRHVYGGRYPSRIDEHVKRNTIEYDARIDLTVFYICKKCAWMYELNQIVYPNPKSIFKDQRSFLYIYLPNDEVKMKELKKLNKKRRPACIECGKEDFPFTEYTTELEGKKVRAYIPTGKSLSKPCVVKLYLKKGRKYLGYYCHSCKRAYCVPELINWEKRIEGQEKVYDVVRCDNTRQKEYGNW